jgi:hypothetical protein
MQQGVARQGGTLEDKNGLEGGVERPLRPGFGERKPLRPGSTMHSELQARKPKGRLSRETMSKLGKVLEAYFDDVRNQGVPDRFKDLLQQYDDRKDDDRKDSDKGSS